MEVPEPRLRIEPMTAEIVEAVEKLEQECFSSPWSVDSLVEELSNPLAVFRVAFVDGEPAGYVGMHHIIDEGYITNIAVAEKFRRQGVATALMQHLIRYGEENELRMITLEAREGNLAAQALYESLKFEAEGRRKNFYTLPSEDAIIMTREL